MTDLRKAAEMALEALETLWDILDDIDTASDMAKENDAWYRQRVEVLQKKRWDTMITTDGYKLKSGPVEALREALAQPEQESVICRNIYEVWAGSEGILKPLTSKEAYLLGLVEQMRDEAKKGLKPLYTAPPKREWVPLTDEEAWECWNWEDFNETWKKMEAKLKEKNGG